MVEASEGKGGLYKSEDRGKTFKHMNNREELVNRPFYYLNVESNPLNSDILYSSANRFMISRDAGKSWRSYSTPHGDNHDIWINSNDTSVWVQSNDGGANITFNSGETWSTQFNQPTAEIYQVEVDDQFPYWLYGGQQDNYSTVSVPSLPPYGLQAGPNAYITNTGGCETGPAVPKPGNSNIVYSNCKGRFGVYNKVTGQEKQYYVGASNMYGHNPKNLKYRFQRVSPIHVSPHDPNVIYHASQFLHKTTDEGVTWETISPDLTAFDPDKQVISGSPITRDITGEEFYSTIYSIRESKLKEGLIWVGANDGPVHVTSDGGKTWKNISQDLPQDLWVSKLYASSHEENIIYASLDGYRWDNFSPYLFKSMDYGKTWTSISSNLPDSPINVVIEDNINQNILYVGNDHGVYVSLDSGINWEPFSSGLTSAAVHDLVIQKDENHLLVGTHGRSIYLAEIEKIQGLSDEILKSSLYIYPLKSIRKSPSWGVKRSIWSESNNPNLELTIFSSSKKDYQLSIIDSEGSTIYNVLDKLDRGFNFIDYNLKHNQNNNDDFLDKGSYKVLIITDKDNLEKEFQIK